jgi:sugar (pentulose or hexulose) kinase
MKPIPVTAIFDVGKTNKKLFLFDEDYKIVYEKSARFMETVDEDGFACENIDSLRLSVYDSLQEIHRHQEFDVKAVNFSSYGASFVFLDKSGKLLTPLYNYLKPYPEELKKQFYSTYGGEVAMAHQTASPVSGSLNSGMQLYRLKYEQPEVFKQLHTALHLPQYLSYLITGKRYSDVTSIGCHTGLWDFNRNDYHHWVYQEGIIDKLAPVHAADAVVSASFQGISYLAGIGLHDSSAALIPYLVSFVEPFILLSTGTWAICMNPFNRLPLTTEDLQHDCLNYIQYKGRPVKASRLFAGNEYERQTRRIAAHFNQDCIRYRSVRYDVRLINALNKKYNHNNNSGDYSPISAFGTRNLDDFVNDIEAYHQLMIDLIEQQKTAVNYVLTEDSVKRIFVDGGFSKNAVYMHLLAAAFPQMEVFAASMAQATAVGTALAIHSAWNTRPLPHDLIELKYYANHHSSIV